jgi:hypothetical protein
MSKRLAKTIQRLEEWRLNALEDPKIAAGAHSNPDVLKKQEELARVLCKLGTLSSTMCMLISSAKFFQPVGDAKDPATIPDKVHEAPDRSELTPENIGHLVEAADSTVRHLYVATQMP